MPRKPGSLTERYRARRAARTTTAKDRITDVGYAAGWGLLKALPERSTSYAFGKVADRAARRNGAGTQQLRKNLRRVVGPAMPEAELDELVQQGLRSYARYWLETFRLPAMDLDHVIAVIEKNCTGAERIDEAREKGKGYILALPHMGNWDVAGAWLINRYNEPFTTVNERLKPESLYTRFVAYRESLGFEILPATGGERPPSEVLKERLLAGKGLCLVADRDLSRGGIEVDFFGEKTRMPAGPALLAVQTGAVLIPVSTWFTEDGWAQHVGHPVDLGEGSLSERVRRGTQAMADAFAASIAAHPQDWHMLQRLWLADLPPRPAKTAAAPAEVS